MGRLKAIRPRLKNISSSVLRAPAEGGGWKGTSPNRIRGSAWMATIRRIKERDGFLCAECKRLGTLTKDSAEVEVDHIVPLSEGGHSGDENLQLLCIDHHKAKTAAESARAQGRRPRQ